jgi:hypothetical protein
MTLQEVEEIRRAIIDTTGAERILRAGDAPNAWRAVDMRDPFGGDLFVLQFDRAEDGCWMVGASVASRPVGVDASITGSGRSPDICRAVAEAIYSAERNALTLRDCAGRIARRLHEHRPKLRELGNG